MSATLVDESVPNGTTTGAAVVSASSGPAFVTVVPDTAGRSVRIQYREDPGDSFVDEQTVALGAAGQPVVIPLQRPGCHYMIRKGSPTSYGLTARWVGAAMRVRGGAGDDELVRRKGVLVRPGDQALRA
jgi:hypothetical protein